VILARCCHSLVMDLHIVCYENYEIVDYFIGRA
jgi:hypothetical protein